MGWAARVHDRRGNAKVELSTKARLFTTIRPGSRVQMSDRSYDVDQNGSLRRRRPSLTITKVA